MKKINEKLKVLLEETNESYYWMGFIMADGHITPQGELRIILDERDKEHLQKLANYLNIKLRERTTKNNQKLVEISTKSVIWGLKVKEKMNLTDKPKTYFPPNNLYYLNNKEKFLSFICGFIDGDGTIGINKKYQKANMIKIQTHNSWYNIFNYIIQEIKKYCGIDCVIDTNKYCAIRIHKYENLLRLKNEFNNLNIPLLERKWNKI